MNAVCMNVSGYKDQLTFMKEYPIVKVEEEFIWITNDESEVQRYHESRFRIEDDLVKKTQTFVNDNINHPGHYTAGKIETIEYIKDKLTKEGYKGYLTGNILKYVSRFEHKNGAEDLKKAQVYMDWLIKELENNEHVAKA